MERLTISLIANGQEQEIFLDWLKEKCDEGRIMEKLSPLTNNNPEYGSFKMKKLNEMRKNESESN